MNAHDRERLRAALPDHFVFDDHRRTGLGRLEGADAFVDSLAFPFEQIPDLTVETLYTVATDEHGELAVVRNIGTIAESGGQVESVYVRLGLFRDGGIVGMEIHDPEDLDVARARFEEARHHPVRIDPSGASRA